jgi:hypothetical protein
MSGSLNSSTTQGSVVVAWLVAVGSPHRYLAQQEIDAVLEVSPPSKELVEDRRDLFVSERRHEVERLH